MKKTFFFFCLLAFASGILAQNLNVVEKVATFPKYQGVVTMEGVSKDDIYYAMKLWVSETFRSAQNVIQLDDAVNGVLLLKGNFVLAYAGFPMRNYVTLKYEAKDGKFRYTADITHIVSDAPGGKSQIAFFMKNLEKQKSKDIEYEKEIHRQILDFARGIQQQKSSVEEDW